MLYLTFWPGVILKKHNLTPRTVNLAIKGIQRLYHDNRITVSQPLSRGMLPDKQPIMVSYRHTMCGALFLYYQLSWNVITRGVIDLMLDRRNKWQNSDGGWAHSDREITESDMWGSAYAIQLLSIVKEAEKFFFTDLQKNALAALTDTLKYFNSKWDETKWAYGGACAEENAVLLFINIAPILKIYNMDVFNKVKNQLLAWLSPTAEDLSEIYITACSDIPKHRLYARMAYALFQTGENEEIWKALFQKSISTKLDDLLSSEMSFLIDLSYEC